MTLAQKTVAVAALDKEETQLLERLQKNIKKKPSKTVATTINRAAEIVGIAIRYGQIRQEKNILLSQKTS